MSTYHTVELVQSELKNIKFPVALQAGTQQPMLYDTVQIYCNQTEADVNSQVSRKYILPITLAANPNSYILLQKICTKLTAGRVDEILRAHGQEINAEDKIKITNLISEGNAELAAIMNNEKLLYDALRVAPIEAATGTANIDEQTQTFNPSRQPWW